MRDLLTALAGATVLVLLAALAVPPFIDWTAHRAVIDRVLTSSLGVPVRSEGRIALRLLPSPRIRVDRLHLGAADGPALDARFVKAEVALAPLLKGEARFTETRIGRAEIRLPVAGGDAVRLPSGLLDGLRGRDLAIEDLHVQQFLVTTIVPATGRTDQLYADDVHVQTPSLTGPWRIEGVSGGMPFRAVSGTPDAEGRLPVKLTGGGDKVPLFDVDARFGLGPGEGGAGGSVVQAEGSGRLVVGPPTQAAGAYLPFTLAGTFKSRGTQVRFETVGLDLDPGGKALRLEGSGRLDLRQWRAGLALRARRLDLDAFLISPEGQALLGRGIPRGGWSLPVMLDLDVGVDNATFGGGEWSALTLSATAERGGGLLLRRLAAQAPGEASLSASGEVEGAPFRFNGPLTLSAPQSDAIGRLLRRLGLDGPAIGLLDGRAADLAADVSASAGDLSLRNLRVALGSARVTGNARYVAPEAGSRGRFEAQLSASGLDIASLPPLGTALAALRESDLALTLQAKDVRFGQAGNGTGPGAGSGTIVARILSDGPRLVVDSLDVTDLAGASASLSGAIGADGAGRISGRLKAPVAAPLLGLLERVWTEDLRLLPAFLREAPIDLAVALDRGAQAGDGLRVQAKGSAGGGTLDLSATDRDGRLLSGTATLASSRAGAWFGRADIPGLQQPVEIRLVAEPWRNGISATLAGTLGKATLATERPLLLPGLGAAPEGGTLRLNADDLGPFLLLAGAARLEPGPWPADLGITFSMMDGAPLAEIAGRVAEGPVNAKISRSPDGTLRGTATLGRLSLPQLAAALTPVEDGKGRPSTRPEGALGLTVAALDLGRGLAATKASLVLVLDGDNLALRDMAAHLAEGRLAGSATVSRRGKGVSVTGEGTLEDASLAALAGGSALGGRLSAALRFAASADTPADLAAGLAGSGTLTLRDLTVSAADPGALGRALATAVEGDDPPREGRLAALVGEELGKAAAQARGPVSAPATIVGGVLRAGPFEFDVGAARWAGTVGLDLRDMRLDARGSLTGGAVPRGWQAGPPSVQYSLAGRLADPQRNLDVGPLSNGLAAFVLQRELERIELGEADQVERQRRRDRIEMDKVRAAALKAAADKAAAEEAERQARQRALQAAADEAARQARERGEAEGSRVSPLTGEGAQPEWRR